MRQYRLVKKQLKLLNDVAVITGKPVDLPPVAQVQREYNEMERLRKPRTTKAQCRAENVGRKRELDVRDRKFTVVMPGTKAEEKECWRYNQIWCQEESTGETLPIGYPLDDCFLLDYGDRSD